MISEEKLKALLEKAGKVTATSMRVTPTMVSMMAFELLQARKQQAKERELEKEANWLAKYAAEYTPCINPYFDCTSGGRIKQCHICLREAAREAVQDGTV